MSEYALELVNITKQFPGVLALDNVNINIKKGHVHALCGENGAGKSTLIKIINGLHPYGEYDGKLLLNGEEMKFNSLRDSEERGIACVQQELALVEEMSIQENIFMNKIPTKKGIIDWLELYVQAKKMLERISLDIDPETKVADLGIGQKQLVEIARALANDPKVLLLDEPTSALSDSEIEILMDIINTLRDRGVTCIYISHKLDETLRIADSITVIRDGQKIHSAPANELTKEDLIRHMVGRPLEKQFPTRTRKNHTESEVLMELKNISVYDNSNLKIVDNASFQVNKGEILGIYGLMGSKRTELFSSLFGSFNGKREGQIYIKGIEVQNKIPAESIDNGIGMVTEDRKESGLNLIMNVRENITLASMRKNSGFVIDSDKEALDVQEQIKQFQIKTPSMETQISNLSGGNQQKSIISKWFMVEPDILILDEPTRGIDVGSKYEIYKIMHSFVDDGIAVVMISSELEEILGMSDRIIVMNEGKIKGEMDIEEATQEKMLQCALTKT